MSTSNNKSHNLLLILLSLIVSSIAAAVILLVMLLSRGFSDPTVGYYEIFEKYNEEGVEITSEMIQLYEASDKYPCIEFFADGTGYIVTVGFGYDGKGITVSSKTNNFTWADGKATMTLDEKDAILYDVTTVDMTYELSDNNQVMTVTTPIGVKYKYRRTRK